MPDLEKVTNRWWDWRVESWDGWSLRLIADNDLTYHHAVEVLFEGTAYVACPTEFSHPTFRDPSTEEVERLRGILSGDVGTMAVFAWDLETAVGTASCFVVAETLSINEQLVIHKGMGPAS